MALTQGQYLFMLAEDKRAKGDELSNRVRQDCTAHYQELLDDAQLISRAKEIIDAQLARFQQWAPRQPNAELGQAQRVQPRIPVTKAAAE